MRTDTYCVGPLMTNCYVILDEATGKAAVIDPGGVSEPLLSRLEEIGADNIEYILLTHCHFDHILGVNRVREYAPRARVLIHSKEIKALGDTHLNGLDAFGFGSGELPRADAGYEEGDIINVGELALRVLHTPGHTVGSSCFLCESENVIFSGDTLFCGSYGRTDLPTGNYRHIVRSVTRLCELDGEYDVYPGHDEKTTLAYERMHNPLYGMI